MFSPGLGKDAVNGVETRGFDEITNQYALKRSFEMTRKGKHAKRFSCWSSQEAGVSLYRLDVPLVCHNPGPICKGRDNHFLGLIDSGRRSKRL